MEALHAAYEAESRMRCHRGVGTFCLIAAAFIIATAPLDQVRFPERAGALLLMRVGGAAALAAIFGLLQSRPGRRHPRAFGVFAAAAAGAVVDTLVLATGGEASPVNVSMTLVLLGVAAIIPWPAAWSALACLVVVGGYVGSALAVEETPLGVRFVDNLLVLSAVSALAVGATAALERWRRREFAQGWARAESEVRFRTVMANAPVALFTLDRSGVITLSEGKGLTRLGFASGQLVGLHISHLQPLLRPHRPEDVEYFERALAGESTTWTGTLGEATFECRLTPVRDAAEQVTGVIGVAIDVTERKQAEDVRFALERQLLEARKLESLGVLAGGVAHDFNNLLVGVLGNVSLALDELPAGSPVRVRLERIEAAARRGADLTRQMLAYAGKGSVVLEPVDLNAVVEETHDLVHASLGSRVTLGCELARDLPAVEADRTQIVQVLMNLVINASEAMGAHEGVVTVRTGSTCLTEADLSKLRHAPDAAPGPHVSLEVADTGCGLDADTLAKIFDPFFSTKFTGRGLGLATVLGVVCAHRGALGVESAPGRGTTIRVYLPSAELPARAEPQPAPAAAETGPEGRTVLLVDDEADVRAVTAHMLERIGCHVLEAGDGREGIEVFRTNARLIDAVILDLTLPRMSGEGALREIRSIRPDARVILMSGYDDEQTIRRLTEAGSSGFLRKPFSVGDLRSMMGKALE